MKTKQEHTAESVTAWVAIRESEGRKYIDMNSVGMLRETSIHRSTAYDKMLPYYAKIHPIIGYRRVSITVLPEPSGS